MVEIGYLAACQTYYHKLVANVSIYDRRSTRNGVDHLKTEHFVGAFLIFGIGLLCSLIVFIAEISMDSMKRRRIGSLWSY